MDIKEIVCGLRKHNIEYLSFKESSEFISSWGLQLTKETATCI